LITLFEHLKKRPTKKVNNRFRPPETNVTFRPGPFAQQKNMLAKTWLPPNGFSIWPMLFFFPAASGVEKTRIGPKRPYLP
jgi:hypothetical protein